MPKTNGKTVLEHLLDNNKKMILASRYQNTIYKGKTLFNTFSFSSWPFPPLSSVVPILRVRRLR